MSIVLHPSEIVVHVTDNQEFVKDFQVFYDGKLVTGLSAIVFHDIQYFNGFVNNIVDLGFELVD